MLYIQVDSPLLSNESCWARTCSWGFCSPSLHWTSLLIFSLTPWSSSLDGVNKPSSVLTWPRSFQCVPPPASSHSHVSQRQGSASQTLILILSCSLVVFLAPGVLYKAPHFLSDTRPPERSQGPNEEREVPDPGDDVWGRAGAPPERTEGEEEKWKSTPQWVAMTR